MGMKITLLVLAQMLHLTLLSASTVAVRWDQNTPKPEGYRLYYGTVQGVYTDKVETVTTTVVLPNMVAGKKYFFAVTAFNGPFESPKSTEINYEPDSFSVAISPASASIPAAGGEVSYVISISRTGFSGAIALNAVVPPGVIPSISTNPVQTKTTLKLKACSYFPGGTYQFTVVGFGCNTEPLTRSTTQNLIKQ